MAQLALAGVGAIAGGSIFGTVGAQIGFLGGSLLGAWLFAPRTTVEGPRLDDLTVSASTYGEPVPIGYGTARMAGNVIWSTGLIETKNKKKVGGKGGPSTTQITYTYSASFAVGLAQRETTNVIRIWGDTKVMYDLSLDESGDPKNAVEIQDVNFRFYRGIETQDVDPAIEADKGVDNAPAYLGLSYLVFEDLQLANFGNRIPSVTAEVTFNGDNEYVASNVTPDNVSTTFPNQDCFIPDPLRPFAYMIYLDKIAKFNTVTGGYLSGRDIAIGGLTATLSGTLGHSCVSGDGSLWIQLTSGNDGPVYKLDGESLQPVAGIGPNLAGNKARNITAGAFLFPTSELQTPQLGNAILACIGPPFEGGFKVFSQDETITLADDEQDEANAAGVPELKYLGRFTWADDDHPDADQGDIIAMVDIDQDGYFWFACHGTSKTRSKLYKVQIISPGSQQTGLETANVNTCVGSIIDVFDLSAEIGSTSFLTYFQDDHSLLIAGQGVGNKKIIKVDIATETVIASQENINLSTHSRGNFRAGVQSGQVVTHDGNGATRLDAVSLDVIKTYAFSNWTENGAERGGMYHGQSNSIYLCQNNFATDQKVYRFWLDRISGLGESLDSVVSDICSRCGLEAADIDVTELAPFSVRSYTLGRQVTGRQALNPLSLGYFFDGVESDWKILFRLRGRSGDFAIPEADLSAHTGNRPSYNVKETFVQEIEIPESVYVKFADVDNEYQPNEAYYKRRADVVTSRKKQKMELAIGFTFTEAKNIATKWTYQLWNEQANLEFSVSQKHIAIDPGDVGTVTDGSNVFSVRIATTNFADFVIKMQGVEDANSTYSLPSSYEGDGGRGVPDDTIKIPGPTDLALFDVPLLRDADNTARTAVPLYLGLKAFSDDWSGGVIFKSQDGRDFGELLFGNTELAWGTLTTKLTASSNWSTWDRFRTFTVNMARGADNLASATETAVLNGANAAIIGSVADGWEIIQFADVADNGDGTYTFENLLRGRRGTELFQEHAVGELFALLDIDAILKHEMALGEVDTTRYFKAVTIGADKSDGRINPISFLGRALYPYSPTDIRGSRDVANDLTITWERRTRYGGDWRDYTGDVPLGEAAEAYEIDIVDSSGAVLRTIEDLTSETATYTAAEQTTDGLTPGDPVTVHVYQVSDIVGRGFRGVDTL